MDQEQKKSWQTPQLIVLVRNQPEEAIASYCKQSGGGGDILTYSAYYGACGQEYGECSFICSELNPS